MTPITPEKIPYLDLIRIWPGHFLLKTFRANKPLDMIGAGNQAELAQRLTEIIEKNVQTILIYQMHKGGIMPIAQLEITEENEIMTLTVPTQPSLERSSVEIVRGDYERIRDQELEIIERALEKHEDESFAHNFLTTVLMLRKFRPKYIPKVVGSTETASVGSKLQELMESLWKGHSILTGQLVRRHELLRQGVELKDGEALCGNDLEKELFQISVFWDEFDPASDSWSYADTIAGRRAERWDELALSVFCLMVRSAPTPLAYQGALEYHFSDQSLKILHERIKQRGIK
jgi:hypothetical protein